MPASLLLSISLSLSLSLSLSGDSRSGSRVFLHHVSTTPIPHGNHTVLSKSNSPLKIKLKSRF
ncbi:hypothetical protein HanPSC8_Chr09g0366021 [Helianthus annuus]|nr:hypothetical protein HanPSC8_Chr09g0366021 [Helianthus annuus]